MKSSNAAVKRHSTEPLEVVAQKPRLRAVEVVKSRKTNLPKLTVADALQDAIRRTG